MVMKGIGSKREKQGVEIHANSQLFFKKVEFQLAGKEKRCHLYSTLSPLLELDQFIFPLWQVPMTENLVCLFVFSLQVVGRVEEECFGKAQEIYCGGKEKGFDTQKYLLKSIILQQEQLKITIYCVQDTVLLTNILCVP